jgi:hypothetical protein
MCVTQSVKRDKDNMATAVRVSSELVEKAKIKAKAYKRSAAGQIEYWAKIGA